MNDAATDRPEVPPIALTGRSLVAGAPTPEPRTVEPGSVYRGIDPASGRELATPFVPATNEDVDKACWQAWQAFHAMGDRSNAERAALLDGIADQIVALGDALIGAATDETGLGPARLVSERDRTVHTLRMFAEVVRDGTWVHASIDTAQPSRRPAPKPDLRRMLRPLGPIAVFGAGNFPLAYSAAGGDTASALAAGCPVVVKGHPGHPGTGELVAHAVTRALAALSFHPGTFSYLQSGAIGSAREAAIGEQLVQHPAIRAVGFTGSFHGGMALARLAAARPDPIRVFAEMGSVNPVFILADAGTTQAVTIAERIVASLTNSNGQMCTCPGLIFGLRSGGMEAIVRSMGESLDVAVPQTMLNQRVRNNFARRAGEVGRVAGVEVRGGAPIAPPADKSVAPQPGEAIRCTPVLWRTTFEVFMRSATLHDEVFGPAAIAVVCDSEDQLVQAAAAIHGSLTGTIWATDVDTVAATRLHRVLEQRVGRLIYNGVPTGVEVCPSMVHGGPYPATNQPHATAVGSHAVHRWCRPVCYQNAPEGMLPQELWESNPLRLTRLINGKITNAEAEAGEPEQPRTGAQPPRIARPA
ncbi:MAG: aldehyde dehydrogenase (NADP(+)) [Phycisphaerales bacterium]